MITTQKGTIQSVLEHSYCIFSHRVTHGCQILTERSHQADSGPQHGTIAMISTPGFYSTFIMPLLAELAMVDGMCLLSSASTPSQT